MEERGFRLRGRIERVGPCPLCGGADRFAVNTRKQVFNCRGCGQGGDVIALVQFLDGCDFVEAVAILAGGGTGAGGHEYAHGRGELKPAKDTGEYERQQRAKARSMWRASRPARGTAAETYLRERGITTPLPATVRFLMPFQVDRHPALIVSYGLAAEPEPGLLTITETMITAVHLVLLKPDGTGKADVEKPKITIASPVGMPMVLAPMTDMLGLGIAEGVENALSVHQAAGLGAWASGGAGFMPKIADAVPDYTDVVTVYADADSAGQSGAHELADALLGRGTNVRVEGARP